MFQISSLYVVRSYFQNFTNEFRVGEGVVAPLILSSAKVQTLETLDLRLWT